MRNWRTPIGALDRGNRAARQAAIPDGQAAAVIPPTLALVRRQDKTPTGLPKSTMIAQRVGIAALRRGARPSLFPFIKVATGGMQARPVATAKISQDDGHQILVKQRLQRPVSPNLGIYKIEQTWLGHSAWTRITGCTLSAAAYAYFAAYLVAPLAGWHLETASLVSAFAALPFAVKGGVKFLLGFPFAYHFINGLRHLWFDLGKGFAKPSIKRGEMVLWTSSILSGLYLAFGL
ncbi:succinate dehydrogenase cytochrome b560 subunit [Metarhizium guizhouense ARSEF 977]|uniref:Succinate dehydrogenase cytochrome b560 subunit n=1 Tax=Metarhizium guizhouense (strain ARSEF 977) TaxID=1276136 RepID=A0A0B4GSV6_METGA|nr:succinate dehydrogenase cytochrome b560 subunit [Metarhizium guizhouense ARSEF 977]